jgi:peptidyl-tRNA hydrolase, PTH1 family
MMFYKADSYMNICGKNVKHMISKNKLDREKMIVIYDCLETKPGKVKITTGNSFKGHNGLKSISNEMGGYKDF